MKTPPVKIPTPEVVAFKNHHPNRFVVEGDTMVIELTNRLGEIKKAYVDADMERPVLFSRRWRIHGKARNSVYGSKYKKADRKRGEGLARLVVGAKPGQRVSFKDGDGMNCRRANIILKGTPKQAV